MCDCGVAVRAVHIGTWTCARALVNGGTTGRTSGTPIAIDLRGCQGGHDIRAYYLVIRSLATASAYYHTEQFVAIQILETQWLFCKSNSPAGCGDQRRTAPQSSPHWPRPAKRAVLMDLRSRQLQLQSRAEQATGRKAAATRSGSTELQLLVAWILWSSILHASSQVCTLLRGPRPFISIKLVNKVARTIAIHGVGKRPSR
jgi:hypothetical protein